MSDELIELAFQRSEAERDDAIAALTAERDALRAQVEAADALADIVRRELPEAGQPITSQIDLDKARALTAYSTARKATT